MAIKFLQDGSTSLVAVFSRPGQPTVLGQPAQELGQQEQELRRLP